MPSTTRCQIGNRKSEIENPAGIPVALGLGANLGAPLFNLQVALAELANGGLRHQCVSAVYLTPPVDCVPGTPDFYNAAVTGMWRGTPEELRTLCHAIEQRLGRPAAHAQDAARMIDLDILLFGSLQRPEKKNTDFRFPISDFRMSAQEISNRKSQIENSPTPLTIPHRRMVERAFVLLPLAEVATDWPVPGNAGTVVDALAHLCAAAPADITACRRTTAILLPG